MATSEELFISVSPRSYRQCKSGVLMSQAELLHSLKHLQNMKVLSRQKSDLKAKLHKLMTTTISKINSIQSKMPTPQVPSTIKKSNEPILAPEPKPEPKEKKTFSKRDEIEEELQLIQAKLQELNS